jgi:serine protease Do
MKTFCKPRTFNAGIHILLCTALCMLAMPQRARADRDTRRTPVVTAIEQVSPAVVNISTEQLVRERINPFGGFHDDFFSEFDDFFGGMGPMQERLRQTLGSGVIIDADGYVLTNAHVILQASKITVTLPDHREFDASVVGADPNIDLAILKIDVDDSLTVPKTGNAEDLMIGETVIAIGNPFGLEHTVTTGVLSAQNRSIQGSDGRTYNNFLQTDASINPGNSGGPLVNLDGEIIGINTAIYARAQGIGFAIPIDRAMRAVEELLESGEIKRAWVGIQVQGLTGSLSKQFGYAGSYGVLVTDVITGGPAADAGLQVGDIIMRVNDLPVHSAQEFYDKVTGFMVGERAALTVFSKGHESVINVSASSLPLDTAADIARQWLGIEVRGVDDEAVKSFKLAARDGVVVTAVRTGGLAHRTGIRQGDVIHQLGNIEISALQDFNKAVVLASERSSVLIMVQRGRTFYYTNIGTNR